MIQTVVLVAMVLVTAAVAHDDELSPARHAVLRVRQSAANNLKRSTDEVNVSAVVMAPQTTQGPYFATVNDFADDSNATAAAVATNRRQVLDGVPLRLAINVYDVVGSVGTELRCSCGTATLSASTVL